MKFNTIIDNQSVEMEFSDSLSHLSITPKEDIEIDCVQLYDNSYSIILDGKSHFLSISPHLEGYKIIVDHYTFLVKIQDELDILLKEFGIHSKKQNHPGNIHAQIPGLLTHIFVKKGDKVKVNQKLFILEAMKMENEINSPINGTVEYVHCKAGDKVEKGNIIMDIIN